MRLYYFATRGQGRFKQYLAAHKSLKGNTIRRYWAGGAGNAIAYKSSRQAERAANKYAGRTA